MATVTCLSLTGTAGRMGSVAVPAHVPFTWQSQGAQTSYREAGVSLGKCSRGTGKRCNWIEGIKLDFKRGGEGKNL